MSENKKGDLERKFGIKDTFQRIGENGDALVPFEFGLFEEQMFKFQIEKWEA